MRRRFQFLDPLFDRRLRKPVALPVIALLIALYVAQKQESSDVRASVKTSKLTDERPSSMSASASAAAPDWILWRFEDGLLIEFTMLIPAGRLDRR